MKKKHLKVLQDIQSKAPKNLTDNILKEEPLAPTVKMILEEAVKDPKMDENKRKEWQLILDTGRLDVPVLVEDPEIVKALDEYYSREVDRAIERGDLPKKDYNYLRKIKKYGLDKRK